MRSLIEIERLYADRLHFSPKAEAEAKSPLMLDSVGKNSSMMQCSARKGRHAAQQPFAMLHFKDSRDLTDLLATGSERRGRVIDKGQWSSMEDKKQEGYF